MRGRTLRPLAAVVSLEVACRTQVDYWRDTLTLFSHADAVTERNRMAQNNIGAALANRRELAQALPHFRRALEYRPDYPEANDNCHKLLIEMGRLTSRPASR